MRRAWVVGIVVVVAACSSPDAAPTKTVPPHCTGKPTLGCEAYGYASGAIACTPEGDVDLTQCVPIATVTFSRPGRGGGTCGNGQIDSVTETECDPCAPPGPCRCGKMTRKVEEC